jgi:tRNA-splicing ligase RtcB
VHRKGATRAGKGLEGIIPGSMGTSSYIVRGLGNPDSFQSCSHGAGRIMGRNEANRRLTYDQVKQSMKGIVFDTWPRGRKGKIDLGEAPAAYKDIDAVIDAQQDLVAVTVKLRPLGVVKG